MYQIAICDDEKSELERTGALLDAYQLAHPTCQFRVRKFSSLSALTFEMTQQSPFDLLLMDIYMPGKNGIDGAKELRENGFDNPIIFLTTSKEHAMEAYDVDAMQYLRKPIEQARFFAVLEKAIHKANGERRRYLTLRTDGELHRIHIREIVYTESQNQYQLIHLVSGKEMRVRMTQADLYESVRVFSDFASVGSTYIVNLSYVDSMNAKVMKLIMGKEIWLPRGSYAALKKQYFMFYRGGK